MVRRQPWIELPLAPAVHFDVFEERLEVLQPKPERAPLFFRADVLRHLLADQPPPACCVDDPSRTDLDFLAVDGRQHPVLRAAGVDLDLVGDAVQHPRAERNGPRAACGVEFLAPHLPGLVVQDLRSVHRVRAIRRIGQIKFVIEGQAVLQDLHLVEVGAEPHLAEEQDARFDQRFTDKRPLLLGGQGSKHGHVESGVPMLQVQRDHHAAEAGAHHQDFGFKHRGYLAVHCLGVASYSSII